MIIFLYIIVINTCLVEYEMQSLYPIKGEILEIPLNNFIQGSNLTYTCLKCKQDNIEVQNIFQSNQIIENNFTFISVSFHEDQIFALTTEPSLNIYMKKNGSMFQDPFVKFKIDQNLKCFSITYTDQYKIIYDCYYNQTLFLYSYSYQDNNPKQIYTSQSHTPNQTKISSIINGTSTYIIYGQSFIQFKNDQNYPTLNLRIIQEQENDTFILTDTLIIQNASNYFVSQRNSTNQTIFIQCLKNINSYVLSNQQTLQFVETIQFNYEIINMGYYYSQDEYYQFDRLILLVVDFDFDYMYFLDVFYSDSFYIKIVQSRQLQTIADINSQIFISKQFIIIYNNHTISILNNERFNQIVFREEHVLSNNTIIYFDKFSEQLFIFGKHIRIHQLQVPILTFASNKSKGNFTIRALEQQDHLKISQCYVQINYSYINELDSNIYFNYRQQQQQYYNLLQFPFLYWFNYLSGPLVKVIANVSNPQLGNFIDNTLQQTNQSLIQEQKYYMVKAFSINLFQECKTNDFSCIFVVAVNTKTMDIYKEKGKQVPFSSIDIGYMKNNVTQIEITFVIKNKQLFFIVCLSFGQNIIQIYKYNNNLQKMKKLTLNTQTFQQFQLLSNSIVLLLNSTEIVISTFDNNCQTLFNSKILEEIFSQKIKLNLINIFINQQYQSRILYINNQNSFIIGYITEQLKFRFISHQSVIFQIECLQVVNNLLIMSYIPENEKIIHFEVWNVKNQNNPKKQGKMRSISFQLDKMYISYYSDNQFFYVQIGLNLNVYNPNLPQHSTLYYRIFFDGLYFTSIAIDKMVFLCFNQSMYLLSPILVQAFQNNTIHQNFFTEQIFNFTFISYLNNQNPINQSNSSVTIINDFLYIDLNKTKIYVNESQSYVEIFKQNISFFGQALQFYITYNTNHNNKDNQNTYKLTNNIEYQQSTSLNSNYNQIIQYNKTQFLLMNNYQILNYNSNITYTFSNYNTCVASTAQNQTIYALCQDIQNKYSIISINLSNATNNNTLFPKLIVNLSKFNQSQNSWIRIQNNQTYIWNGEIMMYYINQNQSQSGKFICQSTQFGFQTIQIQDKGNTSTILYFYFKPILKNQLYYKFAQINNNNNYQFYHGGEKFILLESITQQFYTFDTIAMIVRKNKEIVIMISNSNFNLIVSFLLVINKQNITSSQIIFQSIIQTSPPYEKNNFKVSYLPQYDQGLLLFMYSNTQNISNQTYMIIFYNISNSTNANFKTPLLFEGGYNFTLNKDIVNGFSLIAQNNSFGQILVLFNNKSTLELNLSIFSIKINLTESRKQNNPNITAYNYYNSGSAEMILKINKEHIFNNISFYILFGITIIILITSLLIYLYDQKSNGDEEVDSDDEL